MEIQQGKSEAESSLSFFWPIKGMASGQSETVLSRYLTPSKSLPPVGTTQGLNLSFANLAKCCDDQTWKCFGACQAIWHRLLSSLLSQVQPFH